jgi:hypothetical protein
MEQISKPIEGKEITSEVMRRAIDMFDKVLGDPVFGQEKGSKTESFKDLYKRYNE